MRVFLTLFFLVALSLFAKSQIRGRVVDAHSQAPLEFASVALYAVQDSTLMDGTITNPEGEFWIEKVPTGYFFLKISFIGFRTWSSEGLDLVRNEKRDFQTLALIPDSQQLEGVEVEG